MSNDLINIKRREIRDNRHNDRSKMENQNMINEFSSKITIITFMNDDSVPMDSLLVKFRFNRKITPREFYEILVKNLEGKI